MTVAIIAGLLAVLIAVLANWIPRPARVGVPWVIAALLVLVVISAAVSSWGESSDEATNPPADPDPAPLSPSTTPVPSLAAPPNEWAAAVEAACQRMAPTFGHDIQTLDNVDIFRVAASDEQQTAALIGGFQAFDKDYKTLSSEIDVLPLPSDRANIEEWIRLFHERGLYLSTAAKKISEKTTGGILEAITAFNRYKAIEKDIDAEGERLGIRSCP
ncbi:MAG: hypothetical protein LC775_00830 [Acidobacteria bacterium]|nr:hypothetical protein [Acidobacteriota bacterium]